MKILSLLLTVFFLNCVIGQPISFTKDFGSDIIGACDQLICLLVSGRLTSNAGETYSPNLDVSGHGFQLHAEKFDFNKGTGEYRIQIRVSHIWSDYKDDETTINWLVTSRDGKFSHKLISHHIDYSWVSQVLDMIPTLCEITGMIAGAVGDNPATSQQIGSTVGAVYNRARSLFCEKWQPTQAGIEAMILARIMETLSCHAKLPHNINWPK